ncbi:oocyte zinc finger protein XlCOF6 [Halyomorpha halys]|uniref:oocyte zinc finger protein XlCOF6 n=1 Tax=Halyomorpha halys TaxID=286706 RepID=UPI0006D50196|nr:gastrula zinc finger protein XlCGF57.1-like [Halyomorpha halys]
MDKIGAAIFENVSLLNLKNVISIKNKSSEEIDCYIGNSYPDEMGMKGVPEASVKQEIFEVPLNTASLYCVNSNTRTPEKQHKSQIYTKSSLTKVLREVKIQKKERQIKLNGVIETQSVLSTCQNSCQLNSNPAEHFHEAEKRYTGSNTQERNKNSYNKLEGRYECADCGKVFREKSHLATHSRAHINIRNFKCSLCDLSFKTKTNLSFHFRTHSDVPFTCKECDKTYSERKTLNRHIRIVHSSNEKFVCDQCGKTFKSSANLSLHYTLHTGSKPYSCSLCPKSFVYKSTYVAHMKVHRNDQLFKCNTCPDKKSCQHHCEARPWLCTVCGKGYPLKGTLKNHMKSHNPEKPFKCSECSKSFMKRQSLECHVKADHRGERPEFMCDQCSQSYFNVFTLKRHYLKHTSERSFSCDTCGKAFWMKDALKVHMRSHSSVKSYTCSHCPRAFVHKHSLNAHVRSHVGAQPYSCNVCGKSFVHKYNLSRHERQHQESLNREQVFVKQTAEEILQVL